MNTFYVVCARRLGNEKKAHLYPQDGLHPFARAMSDFLVECGLRSKRPTILQNMMVGTNAKYEADQQVMLSYVENSEQLTG